MLKVGLIFKESTNLPPEVIVPVGFPAVMNESSGCSTCSPAFGLSVLDFSNTNTCVVVSRYNLQFPGDL